MASSAVSIQRDDSLEICTSFPRHLESDSWNHEPRPRVGRAHFLAGLATRALAVEKEGR